MTHLLDLQKVRHYEEQPSSSSQQWHSGSESSKIVPWAGTGARSYFMTKKLAQEVLTKKVRNYWDLHLKDLAADSGSLVALAFPQLFYHEVDSSRADRGSARLLSTMEPAIADVDNIVVVLPQGVGVFNRIQTMIFAMWYAHMIGAGVKVIWPVTESCDACVEQVFYIDENKLTQNTGCKFLRVVNHTDKKAKKDTAHWTSSPTCIWHFGFQCEPEVATQHCLKQFKQYFSGTSRGHRVIQKRIDEMSASAEVNSVLWSMFASPQNVIDSALAYLRETSHKCNNPSRCERPGCAIIADKVHIGVHIRRNDGIRIIEQTTGYHIDEIDKMMFKQIDRYLKTPDAVVHLITDSKRYLDVLWRRYSDRVHYGTCWQSLQETHKEWNKRGSSTVDARVDFEVLKHCQIKYLCKTSSVSNWLYAVNDWRQNHRIDWYADKAKKKRNWDDTPADVHCWHLPTECRKQLDRDNQWLVQRLKPSVTQSIRVGYIPEIFRVILNKIKDEDMEALVNFLKPLGWMQVDTPLNMSQLGVAICQCSTVFTENKKEFKKTRSDLNASPTWLSSLLRTRAYEFFFLYYFLETTVMTESDGMHTVTFSNLNAQ